MKSDCHSPEMRPRWSVDQLAINAEGVFVFGWFFLPGYQLDRLVLLLESATGSTVGRVMLDAGRPRQDVATSFPAIPEALESGFLGAGTWSRSPKIGDRLLLQALVSTGQELTVVIPSETWQGAFNPSQSQQQSARYRQWLYYFNKALGLLRNGKWSTLLEKVRRQLRDLPHTALPGSLTKDFLRELGVNPRSDICLIVDHQLGGGANQYRQQLVKGWLAEGKTALVLTYNLAKLRPVLTVETGEQQHRFSFDQISELPSVLTSISIHSITYNTGVSFVGADRIPGMLLALRRQHRATLTLLIHDYFSVCPSHFLLDRHGKFCDIPDLKSCQNCLPFNPHGFSSLFQGDVSQWRQLWGPLLQHADEIIAFSNSSVELLRKAYECGPAGRNWLKGRPIKVCPHSVDDLNSGPLEITQREKLVIGVVGRMSFHKGSRVIQALADYIEAEGCSERICIIGDMDERVNAQIVRQTGVYERENLGYEIQKSGANVILFPSICPETFSYVTQEIIQLGLPLACFAYGAPAERVKGYEKGLVLNSMEPDIVIKGLRQLFQTVYHPPTATDS